jgi:hypothetical protein
MVHVLASAAFTLVAFGTFALTALMLTGARGEILQALGVVQAPARVAERRPVRIRSAGRWASAQPASAAATFRPRAAA